MIEWKKMSEEQPKEEGEYLVFVDHGVWFGRWTNKGWDVFMPSWNPGPITHWAEINKPEE